MAAAGLGREAVGTHLAGGVFIACENSPASVTLSSDVDKLEEVIGQIKSDILAPSREVSKWTKLSTLVSFNVPFRLKNL